ncbi:MAG: hypothetical protein AAF797_11685 [Planctomycetota bacterium]
MKPCVLFSICFCCVMPLAVGCHNSLLDRSLIFATHTTGGIEVSLNPTEAASGPVTLVIGYRRTEGVINPVFYDHLAPRNDSYPTTQPDINVGEIQTKNYYRDKAYSVIAKFTGQFSAKVTQPGTEAGIKGLSQWFATGDAAVALAKSGGAAALTDNAEVAQAAANAVSGFRAGKDSPPPVTYAVINQLYNALVEIHQSQSVSAATRAQATSLLRALDKSPLVAQVPDGTVVYDFGAAVGDDAGTEDNPHVFSKTNRPNYGQGFGRVISYKNNLSDTVGELAELRTAFVDGDSIVEESNPDGEARKAVAEALESYSQQRAKEAKLGEDILKDPAVIGMLKFLAGKP